VNLASPVSQTFRLNVPMPYAGAINEAHDHVKDLAKQHDVKLTKWTLAPYMLESVPKQQPVTGLFTGAPSAVADAIAAVEGIRFQF